MKVQITLNEEEAFALAKQQIAERHGCHASCVVVEPLSFSAQAVPVYPKDANENVEKLIVLLASGGYDKIGCIKTIRALTGMDLKDAKDLIESKWGEGRLTHSHTRKILRGMLDDLENNQFLSPDGASSATHFIKTKFGIYL